MLLIGSRISTPVVDVGSFACPHCETQRDYQLREAREWLTLYFIPVIKIGNRGRFMECAHCGNRFAPPHPSIDPSETTDTASATNPQNLGPATISSSTHPMPEVYEEDQIEALLVLVACDQGTPSMRQRDALLELLNELHDEPTGKHQLATLIEQAQASPLTAQSLSLRLRRNLSQAGKVKALVLIDELVRCPEAQHPAGLPLLETIAENLGFPKHKLDNLLNMLESPDETP